MKVENSVPRTFPIFGTVIREIRHGAVSRHGGMSKAPFASNNISFGVGDVQQNVLKNRAAIKKDFGLKSLVSAHQVHGEKLFHVDEDVPEDFIADGYDALITAEKGIGLMIGHADCQAVMMYDHDNKVVAAIHNGWRGSVANIIRQTIKVLEEKYGTSASRLVTGVGPSLGPCCSEFINYTKELPPDLWPFQVKDNYFDFWQITRHQLLQCGVVEDAIHVSGICTSCSPDFYSYRRACRRGNGVTGRNGSLIVLI